MPRFVSRMSYPILALIAAWPFLACTLTAQVSSAATESVRRPDSRHIRTSVTKLMGWQIGTAAGDSPGLSLFEAATKADSLGLDYIEASTTLRVSPQINKELGSNLSEDEFAAIKSELASLRMKVAALHAVTFPSDEDGQRRLFRLAKELEAGILVCAPPPASLAAIDRLADESGINIAIDATDSQYATAYRNPRQLASLLETRSGTMGVSADVAFWSKEGVKPLEAQAALKDRLMVLHLTGEVAALEPLLLQWSRELPAPLEHPDACSNCSRPTEKMKARLLIVGEPAEPVAQLSQQIDSFEEAARPAMGYRVEQIARILPITPVDKIPAEDRRKMEQALPRQAIAKPQKARKLLVIDLCPDGGYYHATIANANLALELVSKYTGAYEAVFSNDLDNLKYPKIKQFDAVFLNSTVGEVFPDPDVLNGLIRFVREGGGLAGLHGASYASMDLPEFGALIGAQDGPHHVETATLKVDDPNSPLTKELHRKGFVYTDEFYHFLPTGPYSREKLHLLLSIDTARSDMSKWHIRPDNDYGLVWIKSEGKGRVFNCALGHTPTLFETPALAEMILGGIQFVLGDLPADTTPSALLTTSATR